MKKYLSLVLLFIVTIGLLTFGGCDASSDGDFYLYYKDSAKRSLISVSTTINPEAPFPERMATVLRALTTPPDNGSYTSFFSNGISVQNYALEDNNLILNVSGNYSMLSETMEVLMRASLVKTFSQLDEVITVEIRVEDQPLSRKDGSIIGPEKNTDFLDLFGRGLNDYFTYKTTFYFSDAAGSKLIPEVHEFTYSGVYSLEQAVLTQLVKGPGQDNIYPTIPESVKILSVSTRDGICHVNFNTEFLNDVLTSSPEVELYSIVNTLTELPGISAVQISVNGSSNYKWKDQIDLTNLFHRNLQNMQ